MIWQIIQDVLGGPKVRCLIRGSLEAKEEWRKVAVRGEVMTRAEVRVPGSLWKGATGHGMQSTCRGWKGKEMDFP